MQTFKTRVVRGVQLAAVISGIAGVTFLSGLKMNLNHAAGMASTANAPPAATSTESEHATVEKVRRESDDELFLPVEVMEKMRLKTAPVAISPHAITLPSFQGVLALDNDRLSRVHARFGGEIVEMGVSTDGSDPAIRVGDRVRQGDLLAVVWSTELGQKKSELVDALVKLRSEEQLRDRLKKLYEEGAGAGRNYRDAEKDVQSRLVEVASLERTLRTWRVTDADLAEIQAEAVRLADADTLRETMTPAPEVKDWARVEVRAPISGIVLEKNAVAGDIVGTETDLFKIGDLSELVVWAHVYEEDLPLLESLPHPLPWTVTLPSRPGVTFSGMLKRMGSVIDPTQHTALARGQVENPGNELKIGQFVTVSIQMPASEHELQLPATAVVEDGQQSSVFVQSAADQTRFIRRTVNVTRRFRDSVYIQGANAVLKPGDIVVTSGALMLQNALEQLPPPTTAASDQHVVLSTN